MKTRLVTAITATCRTTPEHLRQAIAGTAAQTLPNLEIVVSDDSPDDSLGEVVDDDAMLGIAPVASPAPLADLSQR